MPPFNTEPEDGAPFPPAPPKPPPPPAQYAPPAQLCLPPPPSPCPGFPVVDVLPPLPPAPPPAPPAPPGDDEPFHIPPFAPFTCNVPSICTLPVALMIRGLAPVPAMV